MYGFRFHTRALCLLLAFVRRTLLFQLYATEEELKPLEGQTQLAFAKRPEASKHQEQEAATAMEKDDAKANEDNEESAQAKSAKSKERRFFEPWLKTYSWLVYEKNENYTYCKVCSEARKSNGMSKEAFKHRSKLACWSPRTQDGPPR